MNNFAERLESVANSMRACALYPPAMEVLETYAELLTSVAADLRKASAEPVAFAYPKSPSAEWPASIRRGSGPSVVETAYGDLNGWQIEYFYAAPQSATEPKSEPAKVPDGWQLVPIQPTAEMCSAAVGTWRLNITPSGIDTPIAGAYKAMLAVAPKPEA